MRDQIRRIVTFLLIGLLISSVFVAPLSAQTDEPIYDIVIRNGRVLDGAGNPWVLADVAIKDGRFVRIGKVDGKGKREIDATGRYVTPGFIDMQDQSGNVLPKNGLAESKLLQGVTTGIAGEGGAPVEADKLGQYFADLQKSGISMNWGTYYGETQARVAVMGQVARDPTPEELEKMRNIIDTAMKNGAMGISTALIYPPASFSKTDEIAEMAKVAGRHGGIYISHIRGEGKELIEAINEAITIGERGKLPVEIYHLKAAYAPGWGKLMGEAGKTIDAARSRGVDVAANMYLYTAGGTSLSAVIPSWASEGGNAKLMEHLKDPATRERLKKEMVSGSPGWWNIVEASGGWDNIVVASTANEANKRFENKSIAQIAKEWKKDPADAAFDLVLDSNNRTGALYYMMSEPDVETAVKFPWVSIGSDASASLKLVDPATVGNGHPRSYGNFPRLIAEFVRKRHVLTLPDAIRKMTSWPAERMKLDARGLIKEGLWADVVIFDYDKIQDESTYELPYRTPTGIDYVLVNGQVVIDHGKHTAAKPGQVIYGPGRQDR